MYTYMQVLSVLVQLITIHNMLPLHIFRSLTSKTLKSSQLKKPVYHVMYHKNLAMIQTS
jgi:hypothetical protein